MLCLNPKMFVKPFSLHTVVLRPNDIDTFHFFCVVFSVQIREFVILSKLNNVEAQMLRPWMGIMKLSSPDGDLTKRLTHVCASLALLQTWFPAYTTDSR